MTLQIGLDTGGTYTDAVLLDETLAVRRCAKSLTTHRQLIDGLRAAVDQVLDERERDQVSLVCLSTTLATNALVEGRGRSVGLILIGFSESQLGRADLATALAGDPMVMVAGGHKASGEQQLELNEEAVRDFIEQVEHQVDAFAVSAVFATRNPEHEVRVQSLIASMSSKPVTCGHHLSTGLDAPRRALTALLNARLIPMIDALLSAARALLEERGIKAPLMVVKGDGSLISDELASRYPVETILSGPAASVVGAQFMCGNDELLIADMGGTTTDVALLKNGQPSLSADGATVGGWRTMVKAIDVRTYALGGDSEVRYSRQQRDMQIGPHRAVPLSLLVHEYPECLEALQAQLTLPMSTTHSAQFVMAHTTEPTDLTYQQRALYEQIVKRPIAVQTLFEDQTLDRALQRLEQRAIVIRSAFTPTDASHISGVQSTWSSDAALLGAQILMRYSADNGGGSYSCELDFARHITKKVAEQSALLLADTVAGVSGAALNLSQRQLIEKSFSRDKDALLSLTPRLFLPIVALGAPAKSYYPACASLLGTEARLPEFAHVANALGAVVGVIRQQQVLVIIPAGGRQVSVLFPEGPEVFNSLEEGAEAAIAQASALAREKARLAGATFASVEVDRKDNVARQGDEEVFFESCITVTCSGRPAV